MKFNESLIRCYGIARGGVRALFLLIKTLDTKASFYNFFLFVATRSFHSANLGDKEYVRKCGVMFCKTIEQLKHSLYISSLEEPPDPRFSCTTVEQPY